MYLATSTCASSPAVGMPLSMTCGAHRRLDQRLALGADPLAADVALDGEARRAA